MKVDFRGRDQARLGSRIPVRYGAAKRPVPRFRWLLVALVVSSPLLYLGWVIVRGGLIVESTGMVTYDTTTSGAIVQGTVREVHVNDNDAVDRGDPLIRLDNPELNARIRHLERELDRISEEQVLARARAERELATAEAEVTALQGLLDSQLAWRDRLADLRSRGAVTATEYHQALTRIEETRSRLSAARTRVEAAERARHSGDPALRNQAEQLRLSLEIAREQRDHLVIRAESSGQVVEVHARAGDTVGPGASLLTMTRPSPPTLTAYLRPADGLFARPGRPVRVALPDGTRLRGEVTERPRLTGRMPPTLRPFLQMAEAALMVEIALADPLPEAMAVHGLPVSVEFARGPEVLLSRIDPRYGMGLAAGEATANAVE